MEGIDSLLFVGKTIDRYRIDKTLKGGEGANGITFKATDTKVGTDVAIKILKRSSSGSSWTEEVKKAARIKNCPYIVRPIDFGETSLQLQGEIIELRYIVSEFVDDNGTTLRSYLEQNPNVTVDMIIALMVQLCVGIEAIHNEGLEHNDLHEGNVMLVPPPSYDPTGLCNVKIVDFGLTVPWEEKNRSDILNLARIVRHLWESSKFYMLQQIWYDKKFIQSLPALVEQIEDENPERRLGSAVEILRRIREMERRAKDLSAPVSRQLTDPFEYLNVEEIPEDSDLLSYLFSDSLPWFKDCISFGTLLISGHRGCGKSMVLKNMRLKTKLMSDKGKNDILTDAYVGLYLHCHHNFYIPFAGKNVRYDKPNLDMVLHHFNLLFTHELVDSIIQLQNRSVMKMAESAKRTLFDFINGFLQERNYPLERVDLLEHLKTLVEREIRLTERYIIDGRTFENLTGASYLRQLCDVLDRCNEFLKQRRIYFLLDDFSDARGVSQDIQKSINRVIGYRNERFCFKITTERYAFIPRDIDGNELVQDREFRYIDLGQKYLSYPNESEEREFIRNILDKRLERAKLRRAVEKLFGNYPFPGGNVGASLGNPETRKQTLYAGFNTIYNLCSGDISTLLELCRDIYRQSIAKKKFPDNIEKHVDFELQDEIIRAFSRERVAMIRDIQEFGDQLFIIVNAMGQISRKYLYEYGQVGKQENRFQEKIRIEVAGQKILDRDIVRLYQAMIKHGIFTDAGTGYPWGDSINNLRLIMRRIYCPVFQVSFRNRECVRMTPQRFEDFLKDPEKFAKSGTKFLDALDQNDHTIQTSLDVGTGNGGGRK